MPYSWDYPASKNKELVFSANGKERIIQLSEIGNLVPMKIPVSNPFILFSFFYFLKDK